MDRVALSEKELLEYAKMATNVRAEITGRALAAFKRDTGVEGDIFELANDVPKSLSRAYSPKRRQNAPSSEKCGFEECSSLHLRKRRKWKDLSP